MQHPGQERLLLDRRSQILVIPTAARSYDAGVQQAERIIELIVAEDEKHDDDTLVSNAFPWHISNRYYEADVHFVVASEALARHLRGDRAKQRQWNARQVRISDRRKDENDNVDDKQIRDVFAALELKPSQQNPPFSSSSSKERTDAQQTALREELNNVQAVLVLVDRAASPSDHKKLLQAVSSDEQKSTALLSGFDLAVSLVVALPSPLRHDDAPSMLTTNGSSDDVEEIYAGEGWEYVDLATMDTHLTEESDDDGDDEFGAHEKRGIDRIREALMTHTWPALKRKEDRRRTKPETEPRIEQVDASKSSQALQLNFDAIDEAGSTQPTAKDEELARAFLAQIEASQLAKEEPATIDATPVRTQADMQAALERFLENEDTQWPAADSSSHTQSTANQAVESKDAWPQTSKGDAVTLEAAFDDDFSDFVEAQPDHPSNQKLALNANQSDLDAFDDDDDELAFLGDADDAMLMRALRQKEHVDTTKDEIHVDFESTLQAVLAHAERVRAIPDDAHRREEAARVALALLDSSG